MDVPAGHGDVLSRAVELYGLRLADLSGGTVVSRHWRGLSKREHAGAYLVHLQSETFPQLMTIPGFVRASVLKREVDRGVEFQVITIWESFQAIQAFAGRDVEAAVVPPVVRGMMVECDERVRHYEIVHATSGSI